MKLEPGTLSSIEPAYAKTGADGRFTFTHPPMEAYSVHVEAVGYVPAPCCARADLSPRGMRAQATGALAGTSSGAAVFTRSDDADGTAHLSARIPLTAAAAIEGDVTDPLGIPLSGAEINVTRKDPGESAPRPRQFRADDRGHFRVSGLTPGSYYLVANEPIDGSRMARWEPTYRATYFPASLSQENAKTIDLAAGQQAVANVRILRQTGVRVAGHFTGGSTAGRSFTQVRLTPRGTKLINPDSPSTTVMNGAFELADVLPGTYTAVAAVVAIGTTPYETKPVAGATTTVEVSDRDIAGLDFALQPLPDVVGRVVMREGCKNVPLRILPRGLGAMQFSSIVEATPDADGVFTLRGLGPGRYRLFVYQIAAAEYSVQIDGRDVPEEGFEYPSANLESLRILVGCQAARRVQ